MKTKALSAQRKGNARLVGSTTALSALLVCVCVHSLVMSAVFVTPWTVAHQAPRPWHFPGKNAGVGCHFLLQGITLTQGSNPRLLCYQAAFLPLSHLGSPLLKGVNFAGRTPEYPAESPVGERGWGLRDFSDHLPSSQAF